MGSDRRQKTEEGRYLYILWEDLELVVGFVQGHHDG
jgi:hypothetical protein